MKPNEYLDNVLGEELKADGIGGKNSSGSGQHAGNKVDSADLKKGEELALEGRAFIRESKFYQAIKKYDEAIGLNPYEAKYYNERGFAHYKKDAIDTSIADFDKAIDLEQNLQNSSLFFFNRGNAYDEKGDSEKAIEDYSKAIELNPYDSVYFSNRGCVYSKVGKQEKAIEDFNIAIELCEEENPIFFFNRGNAYCSLGNFDNAIIDFNKTTRLEPRTPQFFLNKGIAYYKKKDLKNAVLNFDRAIHYDKNNALAFLYRGIAYFLLISNLQVHPYQDDEEVYLDENNQCSEYSLYYTDNWFSEAFVISLRKASRLDSRIASEFEKQSIASDYLNNWNNVKLGQCIKSNSLSILNLGFGSVKLEKPICDVSKVNMRDMMRKAITKFCRFVFSP